MNYNEMTLEEAIHNLEVDEKFCQASGSRSCEEFKIAISCIKKQIARKPDICEWTARYEDALDEYRCPKCMGNINYFAEHCEHCGQKIKW